MTWIDELEDDIEVNNTKGCILRADLFGNVVEMYEHT
jgi:hypothetical protein